MWSSIRLWHLNFLNISARQINYQIDESSSLNYPSLSQTNREIPELKTRRAVSLDNRPFHKAMLLQISFSDFLG